MTAPAIFSSRTIGRLGLTVAYASGAGPYSGAPGTMTLMDPSTGNGPYVLPAASPDGTTQGLQLTVDGSMIVRTSGTDTFQDGSTADSLLSSGETRVWAYSVPTGIWVLVAAFMPRAVLDLRYASSSNPTVTGTLTADALAAAGVPGQTLPGRFRGWVNNGAPADDGSGVYITGDWVKDYALLLAGKACDRACISPGVWVGGGANVPVPTTLPADSVVQNAANLNGIVLHAVVTKSLAGAGGALRWGVVS